MVIKMNNRKMEKGKEKYSDFECPDIELKDTKNRHNARLARLAETICVC